VSRATRTSGRAIAATMARLSVTNFFMSGDYAAERASLDLVYA
jgi:hypothetical protein